MKKARSSGTGKVSTMFSNVKENTFPGVLESCVSDCLLAQDRPWIIEAIRIIEADANRSSDTHLVKMPLKCFPDIDVYFKDESTHPTGSLKHRLARSLILYGLCNGQIGRKTPLIEASSGSTAVSESYFAQLLGLPFYAVVPKGTSETKLTEITRYGGIIHAVEAHLIYDAAIQLADDIQGYYLDQFTNAERATDWRSNNNIAESLFEQMSMERHRSPSWVVVGAGTGGTSATIGRYLRYKADTLAYTKLCVADPENSVFFEGYKTKDSELKKAIKSRIEGVGRPRMEPSFIGSVVDRMIRVKDDASFAATLWLEKETGRRFGPSTGLNFYAVLVLAVEMHNRGEAGSIVTLICDSGLRYQDTCYNADWLAENNLDVTTYIEFLNTLTNGELNNV